MENSPGPHSTPWSVLAFYTACFLYVTAAYTFWIDRARLGRSRLGFLLIFLIIDGKGNLCFMQITNCCIRVLMVFSFLFYYSKSVLMRLDSFSEAAPCFRMKFLQNADLWRSRKLSSAEVSCGKVNNYYWKGMGGRQPERRMHVYLFL